MGEAKPPVELIQLESDDDDDDQVQIHRKPVQSEASMKRDYHKERYKTDKIVSHLGRGAHTKYLVQYRGVYISGDVKRIWLKSDQIEERLLVKYRDRLRKETDRRRESKLLHNLTISRSKPSSSEMSTQVDLIDRKPSCSSYSILARKPLQYDMSTQTDLSYFIFDVVKLQQKP